MPVTAFGQLPKVAELPCRPTTFDNRRVTHIYARHIFLSAAVGTICKCGRYHILEWIDGVARTDLPTREVEVIIIGGPA